MYNSIVLTMILCVLIWIALGLQVIASALRMVGRMIPTRRKIQALEKASMPWVAKMFIAKMVAQYSIRYVGRKMRYGITRL